MNRMQFGRSMVLGLLVLGLSSAVAAEGVPQTKVGTVKKVDVEGRHLVVMVTRELTFTVTDSTKIVRRGEPRKLADIKVDDKVSVEYVKNGETRTSSRITILGDK